MLIWVVLGVAIAMRATLLPAPPFLSSDIYRYVWDGQVQAAGINPYRFVPTAPALAGLRQLAAFPHINRADYAHTIYPPAAQMIFGLVGHLSRTVTGMKVAMAAFELVAMLCLLRLLSIARLPRERILIYAWNPLVLWSFAGDGHVDAAAVGLLAVALLCRAGHRVRLAAAFVAGAALVKFLPAVVAPALARGGRLWWAALTGAASSSCSTSRISPSACMFSASCRPTASRKVSMTGAAFGCLRGCHTSSRSRAGRRRPTFSAWRLASDSSRFASFEVERRTGRMTSWCFVATRRFSPPSPRSRSAHTMRGTSPGSRCLASWRRCRR
jgi:Protein of unknown function (DUF2029).